jgi:hypothetical protein
VPARWLLISTFGLAILAAGGTDWLTAWLGLLAGSGRPAVLGAVFVAVGLLLAVGDATSIYHVLYDWVPGFASFRVPARWLLSRSKISG